MYILYIIYIYINMIYMIYIIYMYLYIYIYIYIYIYLYVYIRAPFFWCIDPYYVESCVFIIKIFFSCILVTLKKEFIGNAMEDLK